MNAIQKQKMYRAMCVVAGLGIVAAGYAMYAHFATGGSFCNINAQFNCDIVNRGIYSELFGVPVAFFGLLSYVAILLFCIEQFRDHRRKIKLLLAALIGVAVGFSAHLAWISHVLLNTWCIVCLTSYALTAILAILFALAEI